MLAAIKHKTAWFKGVWGKWRICRSVVGTQQIVLALLTNFASASVVSFHSASVYVRHRFEILQHVSRVIADWIQFYDHRRPH